jgi:hypothetical protein
MTERGGGREKKRREMVSVLIETCFIPMPGVHGLSIGGFTWTFLSVMLHMSWRGKSDTKT